MSFYLVTKWLLSAGVIAIVSVVGKRLPTLGALIASLPLISVLAMVWMHREGTADNVIAAHAEATFWYVLPSLPLFLLLPYLLRHGHAFYSSLAIACFLTMLLYIATVHVARYFGVTL